MSAPVVHELPVAPVLKVVTRGAVRAVRVLCPFCSRRHWHGWPFDAPDVGLRVAHCHRPNGEPVRTYDVRVDTAGGAQ